MLFNPKKDLLAVHQMGKVGSTSVHETLMEALPETKIFHTHHLHQSSILNVIRTRIHLKSQIDPNIEESLELRNLIQRASRRREKGLSFPKLHLVSLTRDPVARNISAFFENIDKTWGKRLSKEEFEMLTQLLKNKNPKSKIPQSLIAALQDQFVRKYHHHWPDRWVRRELCNTLKIPVFEIPFDHENGYQIYENSTTRLLFLKLERLSQTLVPSLEKFLGLKGVIEKTGNVGQGKAYAEVYRAFLENLILPESFLKTIYSSKMATHFYTSDELNGFVRKWSQK